MANLQFLSKRAAAVFAGLVEGLEVPGDHRKIEGDNGFMPVVVEIVGTTGYGPIVSVAHYYDQNGDLMADPDMTFLVCQHGYVFPLTYQQDGLGMYQEAAVIREDGSIELRKRLQADITKFANDWMRNIKNQQTEYFSELAQRMGR